MINRCINDVRSELAHELVDEHFITDKSGVRTVEIFGSSFVIPEDARDEDKFIFGEPNLDYVAREIEWYESQSLFVRDIPGKVPAIWEAVADADGRINSNYGYLIWSPDNYSQYANVLETLRKDKLSRRAIMIYTRPIMHYDYNRNGMSDFVCTNTVQYLVRHGRLHAIVNMRSNDAIFGFRNDYHWQRHVLGKLAADLELPVGDIHWQTGSLHVYERHFWMVDAWWNGFSDEPPPSTKERYRELYPDSPWAK